MKISKNLSDDAILNEIGHRLARRRLELGLTQAELAAAAGVSKRTAERIEAGHSAQAASLIRLCRILDLLDNVDLLVPESAPGPIELLKLRGRERRRAASSTAPAHGAAWTWNDKP